MELADGRLILGQYMEIGDDAFGAVTISTDKGATWSPPVDNPNGGLRLDAETDIITLQDGRLYAAQRTSKESMRYSISSDGGQTWSVSEPMGFSGHCPYLYRSPDGIIVIAQLGSEIILLAGGQFNGYQIRRYLANNRNPVKPVRLIVGQPCLVFKIDGIADNLIHLVGTVIATV